MIKESVFYLCRLRKFESCKGPDMDSNIFLKLNHIKQLYNLNNWPGFERCLRENVPIENVNSQISEHRTS